MKKVSFIIFSVLVLSASGIHAQGVHIGIKAGVNLGQVNGRSFDDGYKVGFSAGGFAELNFTKKWGIQPEVLFNQTNTTTVYNFNEIVDQGINSQSTKLNYLSIPILLSYKPIPVLSFQLGPQFGILMNSSQTIVGNGKNAFKSGDFAMVGGAQLNVGGFKAGARYAIGLTNINDINDQDSWKNQSVQLYVGLRIF